MRRLGWLARRTVQPLIRRPWIMRQAMRTGLLAHDFRPPRRLGAALSVQQRTLQGRRVWTLSPDTDDGTAPVVLYLHGGGYLAGITPLHWDFLASLAAGAVIEIPLYGLAPRHGIDDALALLDAVWTDLAHSHPGRAVTLMGDSAGGGLALAFAQRLRDTGRMGTQPASLVLLAPWVDITCADPAVDECRQDDPMLARAGALFAGRTWADGADPAAPRFSPLNGEMAGLPPTDLYQGTRDMLRPQAEALAARMRAAGVTVDMTLCPGGLHVYPIFDTPESHAARARIAARLPPRLPTRPCQPAAFPL